MFDYFTMLSLGGRSSAVGASPQAGKSKVRVYIWLVFGHFGLITCNLVRGPSGNSLFLKG